MGQKPCLGDDALNRRAELAERRFREVCAGPETLGRPVSGACRSLSARSAALVSAGASAMREVERGSQRDDVEVAGRYDPTFESNDDGVSLVGVQLDAENSRGIGSASRAAPRTCGSVRKVRGSWRFLGCASHKELPSRSSQSSNRRRETRMWTGVADSWIDDAEIRRERLEIENARDVECVEQRLAVCDREGREPGRERVVVDEHERFACRGPNSPSIPSTRSAFAAGQPGRPNQNSDVRDRAGVQGIDQELRELGPHACDSERAS